MGECGTKRDSSKTKPEAEATVRTRRASAHNGLLEYQNAYYTTVSLQDRAAHPEREQCLYGLQYYKRQGLCKRRAGDG
jgi:hypothetical protein